jgi:uncharacterized tellurite resistance protein B-like protein
MMNIFPSKKTKGIKSHIANLVSIAQSDGNFSMAEKRLVFDIGKRNGLSVDKVKEIIKSEEPVKFKIPKSDSERFDRIFDLVKMLLADGVKTEDELQVCLELAEKLGFRKAICGVLVRKILMGLNAGLGHEQLKKECGDFLKYE